MLEKDRGIEKQKSVFPEVTDPKLFGHEGDAAAQEKTDKKLPEPDTRADWYGHGDDERDKDAGLSYQELAVKKEEEELKGRRPE